LFSLLSWFRLPPVTKAPHGRPSPRRHTEENEKENRQKPVGRDKGSLTEQQTEERGTTTEQIRRKHNNEPHDPDSRSPEQDQRCAPPNRETVPAAPPPPREPSVTSHGMEYRGPFGQVGSAPTPRLCPFLESGEN